MIDLLRMVRVETGQPNIVVKKSELVDAKSSKSTYLGQSKPLHQDQRCTVPASRSLHDHQHAPTRNNFVEYQSTKTGTLITVPNCLADSRKQDNNLIIISIIEIGILKHLSQDQM